jgi:hypothetical protein
VFHDTRDRFGGSSAFTFRALYCLTAWRHVRGRFLPTVDVAIEPLTPLSQSSFFTLTPRSLSRPLQPGRASSFGEVWRGSEGVETAKITVDAFS